MPLYNEWRIKEVDKSIVARLSTDNHIPFPIAILLAGRGINTVTEAESFISGKLGDLNDPFLFKEMRKAVERIFFAKERNEKILIHGDYDVDGITSAVLLGRVLNDMGLYCEYYIPHRVEEGYGLSSTAVQRCSHEGFSLLVSVDCGVTAEDVIIEATSRGIDVIITDHHEPGEKIPNCIAVIDPKISDCGYPFRELSGVGVSFKLAHALVKEGRNKSEQWAVDLDLREHLDLVALGTIADMVPLKGENRILARSGLEKLNNSSKPGVNALKQKSGVKGTVDSIDVAFRLAPRINAAGRIGDAYEALRLLMENDYIQAEQLARKLDEHNKKRQEVESRVLEEALDQIERSGGVDVDPFVIVVYGATWPLGVLGIVSSRLTRKFNRPSLVISGRGNICRGSARSIESFHLCKALKECSDLLLQYGGHAAAAGFELVKENISAFSERINIVAKKCLSDEDLVSYLDIDAELLNENISIDFISRS
ncbi:MAG: single-stranded-DNA-specific exonuclease RecJ [Candidatus Theseobacter exili]|nr:single-stranded-DNA-specific exonuclease RecJ [Candidatus Theseobacter exili]